VAFLPGLSSAEKQLSIAVLLARFEEDAKESEALKSLKGAPMMWGNAEPSAM
jgi:hypothetical protein